jgi:transcriptional regulator with XRE-family HTH domain
MLIELLKNEFQQRKDRNAQYSLRAFAKSLKIHSSTLSVILNGKRKISAKQAEKILRELNIDQIQKKEILLSLLNAPASVVNPILYETLSDEVFSIIGACEHFSLLACLDLTTKGQRTEDLAEKLQITQREARDCLERLGRLQLAVQREGLWYSTGRKFSIMNDIASSASRRVHHEYITKALSSLQSHVMEDRDISGVSMAISTKKLSMAKKMIANFSRELCEYLEADETKDKVYRLNIQLFPLSK